MSFTVDCGFSSPFLAKRRVEKVNNQINVYKEGQTGDPFRTIEFKTEFVNGIEVLVGTSADDSDREVQVLLVFDTSGNRTIGAVLYPGSSDGGPGETGVWGADSGGGSGGG